MTVIASFGQWLKQRRKELDLTQEALAQKLGCAAATIQKIESDDRRPSRLLSERLAQVLDIPDAKRSEFILFARETTSAAAILAGSSFSRSNKPVLALAPLIGRSQEIAWIDHHFQSGDVRLLTLVGPGGIGKTRLAVEAAQQFAEVWFVSLQPLTSPDFIVSAIADAIGFQFYSGADPKQQLLNYLREKSWLLVLDNFEHLLDGAILLSEILADAPEIRLLVTSRERLNLAEEWVFDIDGLAYPADDSDSHLELYSAIELFVHHAQRVNASFQLGKAQRPAVARICRLVGGMPLAIELAASWVRALSCTAIADEIERSLDILETSARNVEPRHRTMRAAFEPTWTQLSEHERRVFMKLSVFRGGLTREAAKEVAGASLRTLSALVDKSLLRVDANGRYDLHELLRQYAAEKLDESGQAEAVAQHHLDYFLKFAEQVETHNFGREQIFWYDQAELEFDNLRAALEWSLESPVPEIGLSLTTALRWFFTERSHWVEGFRWSERLLAANPNAPVSLRAKALHSTAALTTHLGGNQWTQVLGEQSLTLARSVNDRWNSAWALSHIAMMVESNPNQKINLMEESLALFRELQDTMGVTHSLLRRCWLALDQPDYPYARQLVDEAAIYARNAGDKVTSAWVIYGLGRLAWQQDHDLRQANSYFEHCLSLFREARYGIGLMMGLHLLAGFEPTMGSAEYAQMVNNAALTWLRAMEPDHPKLSLVLTGLASIARARGELDRAAKLLGAANGSALAVNLDPTEIVTFENNKAAVCTWLGESSFAEAWAAGQAMTSEQVIAYALEDNDAHRIGRKSSRRDPLSARELEILHLIAEGYTNQETADRLFIGVSTVKKHINHLFDKLDAQNRTQAVAHARRRGLLT